MPRPVRIDIFSILKLRNMPDMPNQAGFKKVLMQSDSVRKNETYENKNHVKMKNNNNKSNNKKKN